MISDKPGSAWIIWSKPSSQVQSGLQSLGMFFCFFVCVFFESLRHNLLNLSCNLCVINFLFKWMSPFISSVLWHRGLFNIRPQRQIKMRLIDVTRKWTMCSVEQTLSEMIHWYTLRCGCVNMYKEQLMPDYYFLPTIQSQHRPAQGDCVL